MTPCWSHGGPRWPTVGRAARTRHTRRNSPRPIWKRLGTASDRSVPVPGHSNVHFQKRLANPRLAPDPAALPPWNLDAWCFSGRLDIGAWNLEFRVTPDPRPHPPCLRICQRTTSKFVQSRHPTIQPSSYPAIQPSPSPRLTRAIKSYFQK